MTRATLQKVEILKPIKGDFANKWKSETFRRDEPAKSPKPKTQEKKHTKSVFGELGQIGRASCRERVYVLV